MNSNMMGESRTFLTVLSLCIFALPSRALEIYFIRHGETIWNAARVLQGTSEYPDLSWKGVFLPEGGVAGEKIVRLDEALEWCDVPVDAYGSDHATEVRKAFDPLNPNRQSD